MIFVGVSGAGVPGTDAPINGSTFSTVKKCSQSNISINKRDTSRFSSDLSSGRRPMSKSDEKQVVSLLIIEIRLPHFFTFSEKVYHLSEHQSLEQFAEVSSLEV